MKSYFIILTGIIVYVIVHIEHIDGIELTHLINLNTLLIEGGIIMLLPSIFKNNFVEDFFEGFDNMFRLPIIGQIPVSSAMNTNIKDLGNDYQLEIELPGYDKKDITASLNKGYLTISATKEEYKNLSDKKDNYIRREHYSGSCKRSFYVGDTLKEEDVKATFNNGILSLVFPKEKKVAKLDDKKQITIE